MESGAIPNGKISASSEWNEHLNVLQGRLRSPRSWSAGVNAVNQWYQVELGSEYTKVSGIATQGRGDHAQWVTKYKLQYSNDEASFNYYQEQGAVKVSHNNSIAVYQKLTNITVNYIKFISTTFCRKSVLISCCISLLFGSDFFPFYRFRNFLQILTSTQLFITRLIHQLWLVISGFK